MGECWRCYHAYTHTNYMLSLLGSHVLCLPWPSQKDSEEGSNPPPIQPPTH